MLAELGVSRPLLVASERWTDLGLGVPTTGHWTEVPSERIADMAAHVGDGVIAVGGGSAIDLGKAASAEAGVPVVSVPTSYSGAEWTSFYGIRDPARRMRGGGSGAQLGVVVYDPQDEHALTGARLIGESLPRVVDAPADVEERRKLLEGAMHAGMALGGSMLALGHAMAQALGGRYGLPHGAMNALTLPAALRYNAEVAPDAVRRFGQALDTDDPAGRVEELARLGGFGRLRDFGVPESDLPDVAAATVERAGARANPRRASAGEVEELLRSIH